MARIDEANGVDGVSTDGDWIESKDQDPNGDVRLIQLQDIGDGTFLNKSARFLTKEKAEELNCTFLNSGDLLVARMPDPLGRACIFPDIGQKAVTAVDVHVWRPGKLSAYPDYIKYCINSPEIRSSLQSQASGTTRQRVAGGKVKAQELPLPPIPEQQRIVRKLDTLNASSAIARTHLSAIAKLVEKYRQAVLERAFNGSLFDENQQRVAFAKPGAELLEDIRAERRLHWLEKERAKKQAKGQKVSDASILKRYKPPETIAEVDCPHDLPANWVWAVADEIVQPGADVVYGIVQPGPKLSEGVPYVRGMDIVDGVIQTSQLLKTSPEIAKKYERASLKGGDILLGIIRATKVAIVPSSIEGANITQGTARFRPSNVISTEFLAYWLASKTAQSWLHSKYRGIDMPGLNLRDVRQLPVPLAPVEVQREIVRRIETAFAKIDRLAAEAEKALKLTDRLDQRILAKAFAGELVAQDPTDEPASALLERIREARSSTPKPKRGRRKKVAT
ncbi:restriction endonuclease subunit S [Ruegeria sp. HKCCD6109]|uniref:restriction endonuclease subunit S n=1 Tax=Ruegeria sp. HKCCD6109 TaxID=2683017 RepID=UPI0014918AE9|nr:restriction endonuclease subunit S [Ruegeria sp. HKCCD6109]NOD62716.1 hypothetical protein [Ruegeria sp. HKCCD6109]